MVHEALGPIQYWGLSTLETTKDDSRVTVVELESLDLFATWVLHLQSQHCMPSTSFLACRSLPIDLPMCKAGQYLALIYYVSKVDKC